jgi:hypothetical protein
MIQNLVNQNLVTSSYASPLGFLALLLALTGYGIIFFILAFVILAAVYIYISFVYVTISKKTNSKPIGIAWIPVIGPALISAKIAKMHWWPILLFAVFWIPVLGGAIGLVYTAFFIIWTWKVFEKLKRPGWWAVLCLIPIVNLVLLGIAAWGKK